jgi:hypothetical protein
MDIKELIRVFRNVCFETHLKGPPSKPVASTAPRNVICYVIITRVLLHEYDGGGSRDCSNIYI